MLPLDHCDPAQCFAVTMQMLHATLASDAERRLTVSDQSLTRTERRTANHH